jgi:hypothetical protein
MNWPIPCCGTCKLAEVYAQHGMKWELFRCNAVVPPWAAAHNQMLFVTDGTNCKCYEPKAEFPK